jgi:hypothetical protein
MTAILVGFFLVGDFEAINPKIIDITAMLCTNILAPMILIETLNGLDDLKDDVYGYFKGSPLLLQVTPHLFFFFFFLSCHVITTKYSSSIYFYRCGCMST